jgi:FtsH-binding integral membrane protein
MKNTNFYRKIAGIVSTALLITASVSPGTLHLPLVIQPWVFILTLLWLILVISGVFTS